MKEIKRFGTARIPKEFVGTQAERDALLAENLVPGDIFYISSGANTLVNAALWDGTEWAVFETYDA